MLSLSVLEAVPNRHGHHGEFRWPRERITCAEREPITLAPTVGRDLRETAVRTAVPGGSMVRMGSPVRFRRGAPPQTSSSGGVRARSLVCLEGRQPPSARDLPVRFAHCESVRAGTGARSPCPLSARLPTPLDLADYALGDRSSNSPDIVPRAAPWAGCRRCRPPGRPSRASIGWHRPGSAGAAAGAASAGRPRRDRWACRRGLRFCDDHDCDDSPASLITHPLRPPQREWSGHAPGGALPAIDSSARSGALADLRPAPPAAAILSLPWLPLRVLGQARLACRTRIDPDRPPLRTPQETDPRTGGDGHDLDSSHDGPG